jgi:hypothetical protein
MARSANVSGGFDKTTAAIVRLEEKVDRLEKDFAEVKTELKAIQATLADISAKMTHDAGQKNGILAASRVWIAIIAGGVSAVVSVVSHIVTGKW